MEERKLNMNIRLHHSPDESWKTTMEILDLDKLRIEGISKGRDFIISEPQTVKKDLKSDSSIFSSKYGASISDDKDAYKDRYRCECGHYTGRLYNNEICPYCNTKVKYVDDDLNITGWVVLQEHVIIHPNLFKNLEKLITPAVLKDILTLDIELDENGFEVQPKPNEKVRKESGEYHGIGMIEFCKRIDEIMEYYARKHKSKKDKIANYELLLKYRDRLLTHSIPVYSLFLRMVNLQGDKFSFKGANAIYNNIAKYAALVNSNRTLIQAREQFKDEALLNIQYLYAGSNDSLYDSVIEELAHKKGAIQSALAGRYNFTGRNVIIPDATLRIDEIKLPYNSLLVLLEQTIINILARSYNITYSDAHKKWWKAQTYVDPVILDIIKGIIKSYPRGIPFIINRNPTINYGSVLQMYCIDVLVDSFTMRVPLQVLPGMGADFDGDCLNITYLINKEFVARCEESLNPRNTMMISKNNGRFNSFMNYFKDTIVNLNSFCNLGYDTYTKDEIDDIKALMEGK